MYIISIISANAVEVEGVKSESQVLASSDEGRNIQK